eukprot:RCo040279
MSRSVISGVRRFASSAGSTTVGLSGLKFDNTQLRKLPVDPDPGVAPRQVSGYLFTRARPVPISEPQVVGYSAAALGLLDVHPPRDREEASVLARQVGGELPVEGAEYAAHCYAGYQFGTFAGQLGDGRAHLLGEVVNSRGERWELQLKGSGATPFSRTFDGRAVLRSCLREFLCSEAMHGLGIPTTRAGCVVASQRTLVLRDPLYSGSSVEEPTSVVLRLAPSFLRFGSFEVARPEHPTTGRAGPSAGKEELVKQLLDYVVERFYPDLDESDPSQRYLHVYGDIVQRTAQLVAQWMCVGFVHGVLNTDNMSIRGLTFDFGPFEFMEYYDPKHVSNVSDKQGLYCYENQPQICRWNLLRLGEALSAWLPQAAAMQRFARFDELYQQQFQLRMRRKLGLLSAAPTDQEQRLVLQLLQTLQNTAADFTAAFRSLSAVDPTSEASLDAVVEK